MSQHQTPIDPRVAEVIGRIAQAVPGSTAAPAAPVSEKPAAETPTAGAEPLPSLAEQLASMITKIESLYRLVQTLSSNPQFLNGVATRIVASEALKEQLRPVILDILREMVVPSPDEAPAPTQVDAEPQIVGHKAELHLTNPGGLVMRAGIQGPDHPTNPNGLEVFLREDGHDHWDAFGPTPLAEKAIRDALAGLEQLEYGRHYYVDLFTYWDRDPSSSEKFIPGTPVTVIPVEPAPVIHDTDQADVAAQQ